MVCFWISSFAKASVEANRTNTIVRRHMRGIIRRHPPVRYTAQKVRCRYGTGTHRNGPRASTSKGKQKGQTMRIAHVAYPCHDPQETHRFYTRVLGLRLVQAYAGKQLLLVYALPDGGSL